MRRPTATSSAAGQPYHGGEFYRPLLVDYKLRDVAERQPASPSSSTSTTSRAAAITSFPKLNVTLNPVAYSALVFNNCLPNGEPDERSLPRANRRPAAVRDQRVRCAPLARRRDPFL